MAIRNWFSRPLLSFQQLVTTHCCCAGAALACTHQRRTTLITPHSSYLIVTHVVEQVQLHRFFIGASSISLARTQHQKIRLQLHTCHTSLTLMLLNRDSCTGFSLAPQASVWLTRITQKPHLYLHTRHTSLSLMLLNRCSWRRCWLEATSSATALHAKMEQPTFCTARASRRVCG